MKNDPLLKTKVLQAVPSSIQAEKEKKLQTVVALWFAVREHYADLMRLAALGTEISLHQRTPENTTACRLSGKNTKSSVPFQSCY